jgi:3-methylcrotonyl-CoA carboxylase alpha subunit
MSEARRQQMGEAAVAAAKAVGYVGAGTVEFVAEELGDGDIRAYFMEMNTRLQVEHPVTEAITGIDLVEWQLRVADGQPLPLTQQQLAMRGHAIEARICAENPEGGFLPATGTMRFARWPTHVSFERSDTLPRIDRGFDEGDAISPHYDSMIAKLIVWGENRRQALARLDAALAQTHIVGLATNVAFLRRVVASDSFAKADLDTALIEREHRALFGFAPLPLECAAAGVIARELANEAALQDSDPWSRRDGWRLFGGATRRFDLDIGSTRRAVTLHRAHDGALTLAIGEQRWPFRSAPLGQDRHDVILGDARWTLAVYAEGERITVFAPQGTMALQEVDALAHAGEAGAGAGRLTAPMPGKMVAFLVKPGDAVKAGQPLAVMEAMKMEHTIAAPRDGTVAELLYGVGDQVTEGAELLRVQAVD